MVMKRRHTWGAWLAGLVEHMNLDVRVLSSSPTLGIEITYKKSPWPMTTNNYFLLLCLLISARGSAICVVPQAHSLTGDATPG